MHESRSLVTPTFRPRASPSTRVHALGDEARRLIEFGRPELVTNEGSAHRGDIPGSGVARSLHARARRCRPRDPPVGAASSRPRRCRIERKHLELSGRTATPPRCHRAIRDHRLRYHEDVRSISSKAAADRGRYPVHRAVCGVSSSSAWAIRGGSPLVQLHEVRRLLKTIVDTPRWRAWCARCCATARCLVRRNEPPPARRVPGTTSRLAVPEGYESC